MPVIDEWLARIEAGDQLTLAVSGRERHAARFADLYVLGESMYVSGSYPSRDVWIAPVTPESRAELRARLEPFTANDPEASWAKNPAGTADPFEAGCRFAFEWSDMGMRGWWSLQRQPDGTCVIVASQQVDDTAGVCPVSETKETVDEETGREKLCEQLRTRNTYLMPSIGKPR